MKKCSTCGETKNESEFNANKTKKDGLQSKCTLCQKAWYKEYYRTSTKEKSRLRGNNEEHRDFLRSTIRKLKDFPCVDCGVRYPYYVMDWDHIGTDKLFNISKAVGAGITLARLLEEISKCELVCANCHRVRTHERL